MADDGGIKDGAVCMKRGDRDKRNREAGETDERGSPTVRTEGRRTDDGGSEATRGRKSRRAQRRMRDRVTGTVSADQFPVPQ